MGFRVLLIGVTGKDPATVHEAYSVVPTGEYEEEPEASVDVDYIFDVPVELFTAMGGMRYDRELESGDRWQVLKRRDPPRRHRWFWPFR